MDGVWFAFASEETGRVIEASKIKEIKINPSIDAAIFTNSYSCNDSGGEQLAYVKK